MCVQQGLCFQADCGTSDKHLYIILRISEVFIFMDIYIIFLMWSDPNALTNVYCLQHNSFTYTLSLISVVTNCRFKPSLKHRLMARRQARQCSPSLPSELTSSSKHVTRSLFMELMKPLFIHHKRCSVVYTYNSVAGKVDILYRKFVYNLAIIN